MVLLMGGAAGAEPSVEGCAPLNNGRFGGAHANAVMRSRQLGSDAGAGCAAPLAGVAAGAEPSGAVGAPLNNSRFGGAHANELKTSSQLGSDGFDGSRTAMRDSPCWLAGVDTSSRRPGGRWQARMKGLL
jgi:hypothetical protein